MSSSQRGRSPTHHHSSGNTINALEWWDLRAKVENSATSSTGTPNVVLDQISGSQRAGRLLAVLGPSGSGKTTFLNAFNGLYAQGQGAMRVDDAVVRRKREKRGRDRGTGGMVDK